VKAANASALNKSKWEQQIYDEYADDGVIQCHWLD